MPFSIDEFAAQIKAKYPDYASWPNDHLVTEIVAKHPEYRSWVTLDPRTEIAIRKLNPPATAHGDPNAGEGIGVADVLGAGAKGLAHLAGIPTSMAEVPDAVKNSVANSLTMGASGAIQMGQQIGSDIAGGHIPIIGRPIEALAAPGVAVAHGNAPTRRENLGAVESGTSLGAMAAMAHPAVAGAIAKVAPGAGAALEESGTATYADALMPKDAPMRPLAESIGSKLANEGKVLRNPVKELGPAIGGTTDIPVQKFAKTASAERQLAELQAKYPDAQITDAGTDFVVRRRTPERVRADALVADMPSPEALNWYQAAKRFILPGGAGAIGAKVGSMIGGAPGAAIGVAAAEAPFVIKNIIQSPLWRTTSGAVKTALGKAMQAQDFAAVTTTAAKILGGINLEDAYGHDSALFNLMQTAPHELHDYDAIYVNSDGSQVPVPFHVQKRTKDVLTDAHNVSGAR